MVKTWSDRSRDDGILSGRKSGRELFGGEVVWHQEENMFQTDLPFHRIGWSNVVGDQAYYSGPQQHWIAALQGKVELLPTAQIALDTMLISEAIYLSSQRGAEVSAEEVAAASVSTAAKM